MESHYKVCVLQWDIEVKRDQSKTKSFRQSHVHHCLQTKSLLMTCFKHINSERNVVFQTMLNESWWLRCHKLRLVSKTWVSYKTHRDKKKKKKVPIWCKVSKRKFTNYFCHLFGRGTLIFEGNFSRKLSSPSKHW